MWDNYTVDSHAEQVTLHSHLPGMQGIKQVIYQLNHWKTKLAKFYSYLFHAKGNLEFFF